MRIFSYLVLLLNTSHFSCHPFHIPTILSS